MVTRSTSSPRRWGIPVWLTCLALVATALFVGLGDGGLWGGGAAEIDAWQRVRAAQGAALDGLVRAPELTNWLHATSVRLLGDRLSAEAALRLPHAIGALLQIGLAGWALGRARRWDPLATLLATLVGGSMLGPVLAARLAVGDPIGGPLVAGAVMLTDAAASTFGWRRALQLAAALTLTTGAVAAAGIVLGGVVPAAVAAVLLHPRSSAGGSRVLASTAAVLSLSGAGVAVWLAWHQGDGFIPLLAAAKHPEVADDPTARHLGTALEELGYHLVPWAPFALLGVTSPRTPRFARVWFVVAASAGAAWSTVYGPLPLALVVPATLCATAGLESIVRGPAVGRRTVLVLVLLILSALHRDAERTPGHLLLAFADTTGQFQIPARLLDLSGIFQRWLLTVAGAAVLAYALAPRPRPNVAPASARNRPGRRVLAATVLAVPALVGVGLVPQVLATAIGTHLSPRAALERHEAWAQRGELPGRLGIHSIRDPSIEIYAPPESERVRLEGRRELLAHLSNPAPAAALVRASDLPALHQDHRQRGWPFFVLDRSHADWTLVANVLPTGAANLDPIPAVVASDPPELAHPTLLRFEDYVEIVGWEVTEPLVRGRDARLVLAIRVLRQPPAGTQIFTRFQTGRTSRINTEAVELTGGIYPPNYWRPGDVIRHTQTFHVPLVEVASAPHELVLGLRRTEKQNYTISVPAEDKGEFGVELRAKERTFARIGVVDVY